MTRPLLKLLCAAVVGAALVVGLTPGGREAIAQSFPQVAVYGNDSGTLRPLAVDGDGNVAFTAGDTLDVNVAQVGGSSPLPDTREGTLQSAATANGNGTTINTAGFTDLVFSVNCSVSCAGGTTINFEGTADGTNYEAIVARRLGTLTSYASTVLNQASGTITLWRAPVASLQAVRARISAYSAGTVTVTALASSSGGPEVLSIASLKPDGTNALPSGDAAARAIYTQQVDPCSGTAKTFYVLNNATAGTVEIANAVASQFFYICAVNLVAAAAQTIAIAEDDTDGCGSLTAGLHGGATAATGWSFAANGGIALGDGGSTVMKTATANRYLCYIIGQSQQISGTIAYVSAP